MSYCIVVEKELAVSYCPLPVGACFWKHRQTGMCMYTAYTKIDDAKLSASELATLVGLPPPSDEEVRTLTEQIKLTLKQGIT